MELFFLLLGKGFFLTSVAQSCWFTLYAPVDDESQRLLVHLNALWFPLNPNGVYHRARAVRVLVIYVFGESLHFMDFDATAEWNQRLGIEDVNNSSVSAFVSSGGYDASWHGHVSVCGGRRCIWNSWNKDRGPARWEFDQVWNWLLV